MQTSARVIPFRAPTYWEFLGALDRYGVSDDLAARLVDRWFGPMLEALQAEADETARMAQERRYADGHRASDLRACTNPRCLRCWQLTPEHEDRAIAIGATGSIPGMDEIR